MKIIISENHFRLIKENQKVLNQILDKISHEGMDSLTFREKDFLDKFSKGNSPNDLGPDATEKIGSIVVSSNPKIPQIVFVLNDVVETDRNIEYFGAIYFNDKEYIGVFVTDPNNKLEFMDFYFYDENMESINLLDEIEGLEKEFELFFQDDILPMIYEQ